MTPDQQQPSTFVPDPATPKSFVPDTPEPSKGLPGMLGTVGQGVVDLGVGAVKSVPETLLHIIQLITNLSGQHQIDPKIQAGLDAVKPDGIMQGVGDVVGQVAQSVLPAGAVTRGARAVEGAVSAAPMLSKLPQAVRAGLGAAGRIGTEAIGTAATSAALGGDPMTGGVVGGALSALNPAVPRVGQMIGSKAEDQMVRALGREGSAGPSGRSDLLTARERAPELLARNFGAMTQEGAGAKAGTMYDQATRALDDVLSKVNPKTGVDLSGPKQQLAALMNALRVKNPAGASFVPDANAAEFELLGLLNKELDSIGGAKSSAQFHELRRLRQAWDKLGKWDKMGTTAENLKAETYRSAANAVRAAMAQNNPAVAAANKEFSFWSDVSNLIDKSLERPSNGAGVISRGLGSAAGAAAGAMFGGAEGAAAGSLLGNYAVALTKTNGWRYLSANVKNDLANALASGVPDKVRMALSVAVSQIPKQFQFEAKNAVGESPITIKGK